MQLVFIIRLSSLCQCYIMHVDWFDILCCHPVSVLHYTCGLIWYFVLSPCVSVTLYMWIDLILCHHPVSVLHYRCGLIWYFVLPSGVSVTLYMWIDLILCHHPVSVLHYRCRLIWYFVLSPCVSVTSQAVHSNSGESSLLQLVVHQEWTGCCV